MRLGCVYTSNQNHATPCWPVYLYKPHQSDPQVKPARQMESYHGSLEPTCGSVNDGIEQELCSMEYLWLDKATSHTARSGRGTLPAKMDIACAYRMVWVYPEDRPLLAVHWDGLVYFDTRLPLGLTWKNNCHLETKIRLFHQQRLTGPNLPVWKTSWGDTYRHLIKSGASVKNISMLCVKLAKKAIFGEEVIRCTPGGTHDMPGLPAKKLYDLLMQYPQYWQWL